MTRAYDRGASVDQIVGRCTLIGGQRPGMLGPDGADARMDGKTVLCEPDGVGKERLELHCAQPLKQRLPGADSPGYRHRMRTGLRNLAKALRAVPVGIDA